jgi:arginase
MGPSAVRAAGLNAALKALGYEVQDAGNVNVKQPEMQDFSDRHAKYLNEIAECSQEVAHSVSSALEAGYFPLSLGGDHSIAVGTLAGVSKFYHDEGKPIGLLWLDAHADMNTPATSPSGNVHGMPFAATLGYGPEALSRLCGLTPKFDPQKCVLIGVRDLDGDEREMVRESGVNVFTMRDIDEHGMRSIMDRSIAISTRGTHGFAVSFDMDVVDPDEAPGVGTPVRGGITFREAHLAMEMIADSQGMVSLELVEINPIIDMLNKTAILGVALVTSALGKRIL